MPSRTLLTGSSSLACTGQKSSSPSSVTPSCVKFAYFGTTAAFLPQHTQFFIRCRPSMKAMSIPAQSRAPTFLIFTNHCSTYFAILDNQRSLGPMTDGMAAAQENLNVFYSLGNSRGHRGSPWATPEHPSHDNHNHREEMRTPFHSKASSWGGIPSTEAGPGIDFSTRARHGPPAKGFASPLGTPAVSRDQIMRGAASSQGAEEGGGRDACRNAEEVMRLSRAWRLALLGGGTPPAPALQIEAGAASGTHDLHALPTAKSTTSSQPQLLGEGTGGGADELQRGGKPSSSSTTTTSTTPSSHERECRVSEGGNGKGQVLVSWRQGAMDDDEDFWPAKDDGTDDDALHQEAGKDVDAISLVRHSLRKERHPPPPPIIPLSPPDAMPTEPRIKEWLRAHDLQCIEPRLVAAGGGGVEGASLLTESDCDSISMGLSNIRWEKNLEAPVAVQIPSRFGPGDDSSFSPVRSRLWRALCELRQGHLVPQLRGSHHAASTQNAPSSPSSANHPPPPIQNSPQSSREMPTNVDVGAVSAATAPSPVLLKRSSHESSTFGMADGSPEDSSISPLSWRVLEKREAGKMTCSNPLRTTLFSAYLTNILNLVFFRVCSHVAHACDTFISLHLPLLFPRPWLPDIRLKR